MGMDDTSMTEIIPLTFEGRQFEGRRGESLAAALIAAGERVLRVSRTGAQRSIFCGMGICQDCLIEVDGRLNQRACMVKVDRPANIRRQRFGEERAVGMAPMPPRLIGDVPQEKPEVLVIGAGPGGLAAASAARRAGASVLVVDERPLPGGQFFKQVAVEAGGVPPDRQHREGRRLIEEVERGGVEIRRGIEVWGAFAPCELAVMQDGTIRIFEPRRLIVATGAYERAVPIPGWTLPGVMTTGAAQTLWRSYRRLPGQRVLIAGNGPLNLQVASELAAGGAKIAAVVETAPVPMPGSLHALARMFGASPRLVLDGLRYRTHLLRAGLPVLYGSTITRVEASGNALEVSVGASAAGPKSAGARSFSVDVVCMGFGFHPSNEILRALGCEHDHDAMRGQFTTRLDAETPGKTTVAGVFALGDCTGLGGARVALAEGTLVGATVAADLGHRIPAELQRATQRAREDLARHRRFQAALWQFYAGPRLEFELAAADTVLCRCEEVTLGEVDAAIAAGSPSIGELKRATRVGMGSCQGRYCGPLVSAMLARQQGCELDERFRFAPRMPVKPIAVADIARRSSA